MCRGCGVSGCLSVESRRTLSLGSRVVRVTRRSCCGTWSDQKRLPQWSCVVCSGGAVDAEPVAGLSANVSLCSGSENASVSSLLLLGRGCLWLHPGLVGPAGRGWPLPPRSDGAADALAAWAVTWGCVRGLRRCTPRPGHRACAPQRSGLAEPHQYSWCMAEPAGAALQSPAAPAWS